jgi:hypothetical protein
VSLKLNILLLREVVAVAPEVLQTAMAAVVVQVDSEQELD